jgi:PAS domain S-box-containing protein
MKKEEFTKSGGSGKTIRVASRQPRQHSKKIIPSIPQLKTRGNRSSFLETERRIIQQSEFSELVIESLAFPYMVIDAHDYRILKANPAASLGDFLKDTTCYKLLYNKDRPCRPSEQTCPVREVRRRGTSCVFEHHHYDDQGNIVKFAEIHAHPVFDPQGRLAQVVTCTIDKTAYKQTELRLRKSASMYRSLFQCLPIGIVLVSFKGDILQSNSAMSYLTGYADAELAAMNVMELLKGWEEYEPIWEQLKSRARFVHDGEVKLLRKDGSPVEVRFTISRVALDGSTVVLASFMDVTPRKRAEEKLKKSLKTLIQKNLALTAISEQIEIEKHMLKDAIGANVRELVFPLLEKLRLTQGPNKYLDMLERCIRSITDKSGIKIDQIREALSPREIEICTRIQSGLTSKEIAQLLGVSYQTVEKHRRNIRKKIGLSGKKINLASYLQHESTLILNR